MRGYSIGAIALTLFLAVTAALAFVLLPSFTAEAITLGTLSIILLALASTYKIWLWDILNELAPRDIVVTNVMEGTGKLVMQNGEAVRFLTSRWSTDPVDSWHVEQEDDDKTPALTSRLQKKPKPMSDLVAWIDREILPGGMRWVGFKFMGYKLFEYNFRWEVLRSSEPKNEDRMIGKEQQDNGKWVASFSQENTNYIFLKDTTYYFGVMGAETKGREQTDGVNDIKVAGMPVDIHCVIRVRIVNPYLTLIFLHDWLETIFEQIGPYIRSWASQNYYEDIIGKLEVNDRNFDQILTSKVPADKLPGDMKPGDQPKSLGEYLERAYGVRIKNIGFDDVVPPDLYVTASEQRAAAEQDKLRIATLATAERDRLQIEAEGEAKRIKTVVAELQNPIAERLRAIEGLEKVGENGNMVVLSGEHSQVLLSPLNRNKGGS